MVTRMQGGVKTVTKVHIFFQLATHVQKLLYICIMEEPLTEKIISLEEIDYTRFWGDNDKILDFVRILFPKLKLIARGDMLKVVGSAEDIAHFEGKLQAMKTYYDKVGRLNETVIMQIYESGGSTPEAETNEEILVHGRNGLLVRARTPNQQAMVQAVKENDMVFAIGPAGTGKTYTAVALAVRALKNKEIRRIILTRPAVEAGENLGFLPGDLRDKLDPYRTLDNAFVILDEAQNATSAQLKMFLTRMGRNAKFIITGDITQIDLPRHQQSGLVQAMHILNGIKGISIIQLDNNDVIRHKLVTKIIRAYERNSDIPHNEPPQLQD